MGYKSVTKEAQTEKTDQEWVDVQTPHPVTRHVFATSLWKNWWHENNHLTAGKSRAKVSHEDRKRRQASSTV